MVKIKNVNIEDCNGEQKIAYNIAFNMYIHYFNDFNLLIKEKKAYFIITDFLRERIRTELKHFKPKNKKLDIDLIFHYLNKNIYKYFILKYKILTSYKNIGDIFTF